MGFSDTKIHSGDDSVIGTKVAAIRLDGWLIWVCLLHLTIRWQVDVMKYAKMVKQRLLSLKIASHLPFVLSLLWICLFPATTCKAVDPERCVVIEVYYRTDDRSCEAVFSALEELRASREGILVVKRNVDTVPRNRERLNALLRHYKLDLNASPVVYGCNRIIHNVSTQRSWTTQLREMLQIEIFVRTGCSHCAAAKQWIPTFLKSYPGLTFVYRDIAANPGSAETLSALVERHQTAAASVPVFYLCDRLFVGFESQATTGNRLHGALKMWTRECQRQAHTRPPQQEDALKPAHGISMNERIQNWSAIVPAIATAAAFPLSLPLELAALSQLSIDSDEDPAMDNADLPLPSEDDSLEIPLPDDPDAAGQATERQTAEENEDDNIEVPVLGRLSASKLGMPLFTVAIGLVDGFNPCAMWVLLFLLSILVNLKDRRRILAIAGTFVIVSGLAYYAFMAAWLNVFMLIGYLRPIQICLALLAVVIGMVHIKDFFAFRKGFSLSIPESAKPGLYARVRKIVTAENLTAAIAGAFVLAVLVNVIELLCTAGLPALYTNILVQQGFSSSVRYAYLGLYILAYMFDDGLMVGVVVMTLSKKKLQESHGRWLKLISGSAILILGVIMLFKPEWLH